MGQRMKPQPIPSLLEYKTIRLRDRYSPPDTDPLERGKAASEQGQKGGLDANGKPASATSQQLSPSLASYGGMHSFSQMAQFLPSICNQNIKRRPSSLLPLSMPGLSTRQSSEDTESTIKPFYRSSMPEAFLSASSNLINSSATVPSYVYTGNFFYNQFGAKSSSGLECIGKSDLELKKPTANSEPVCKLKSDTLPPIGCTHCTAHPESCSCRHRKNSSQDKSDSPEKKSAKKLGKEGKRESKAVNVAGRRKVKRGGTYGMEPKVTKPVRKSEKKVGLKKNHRQNCQTSLEARKSIGSQQKQQVSHHGQQQTATHEDEEEEGISSYVQGIHTNTSPPSNMSDRDDETYYDLNKDEEESELDYFHRNSSILHPPPNYLPPVTKSKARIQRTSLLEDLGEQSDNLNNIGWAKDGFLEDSALKRVLLLRSRALYNTSSNNTTVDFDDKPPVCSNVLCENVQQETKDEISEEVKEIRKSLKVSARKSAEDTQEKNVPKQEDFEEKKLVQPQHICSVTWQEVLPHLGPKKKRTTKSSQRSSKLNPVVDIKSQSSNAAEASRHLQKSTVQKLRDHTKCISTVPETLPEDESTAKLCIQNLPPVQPFTSSDLAICCRARTSKSLSALPLGKEATDLPNLLPDAATPCSSYYNKFVKMFSLPVYKTRFPPNEQTRREKKFEGHIAGKKVKPVGHLEAGPCECPKEELVEPEAKPK